MDEIPHAIFLSYSTPDAVAVRRICEALRASGLEVWFDQSELRGGDAWDASIRRQIRDCALFMPVISANTESRGEGYFRLEWRLAVERSNLMADDQAFLMPVVIDDTSDATARVPDRFRERQWTRLPGGECTPAFIAQVRRTLAGATKSGGTAPTPPANAANAAHGAPALAAQAMPALRRHKWALTAVVGALVLVALVAGLIVRRNHPSASRPAQDTVKPGPADTVVDPRSIAVLPFTNLTGRAEDAYLADGLQEEILNALARVRALKVISRTSAAVFRDNARNVREVGERLGVGSALEGSIRREGSKLRLTVQLIDTRNDHHLLAADYDRDLGHILGLQSEVARKIAEALAATLSRYERGELERVTTNSGDAYTLYLRAVAQWRQSTPTDDIGVTESQHLLEQALRLDPEFTDALALLSQACTWQYFELRHEADGNCARKYYERALALDAQLPEAQLARGLYEMYVSGDLDQAIVDLDAVVKRRPNDAEAHSVLGFALRRRSRFDEAGAHFMRSWDLDPLNHAYAGGVFSTLVGLRRYPDLIGQTHLYQRRFPAEPYIYVNRALIECHLQHSSGPLRQVLRDHGDLIEDNSLASAGSELARIEGRYLDAVKLLQKLPVTDPVGRNLQLGFLYWAAGRTIEAGTQFRAVEAAALPVLKREPHAQDLRTRLTLAQSMLGEHAAALANAEILRAETPEARDPINGPAASFVRSIVLVRAGRTAEGYAEVTRLMRVPFGAPTDVFGDGSAEILLAVKDDRHFDELIHNAPRL